jgi:hypothetical protein
MDSRLFGGHRDFAGASHHIAVEALARSPHVMRVVKDSNTAWLNGKAHLNYESKRGTVGMRSVADGLL